MEKFTPYHPDFNPVFAGETKDTETVTFKVSDFEKLIDCAKVSVISEINEVKKRMSNEVIENLFKYLDDGCTAEDVLASLEEHKKSYADKSIKSTE